MNTPLKTWAASSGMRLAGTVICLYSALAKATAADNESMNLERSLLREGISWNRQMKLSQVSHKELRAIQQCDTNLFRRVEQLLSTERAVEH